MNKNKRIVLHIVFLTLYLFIIIVLVKKGIIYKTSLFLLLFYILATASIFTYLIFKIIEYNRLKFQEKINTEKKFLAIQKILFSSFERMPLGVMVLDLNGVILYENPALRRLFQPDFKGNIINPILGRNLLRIDSIKSLNEDLKELLRRSIKKREPFSNIELPFTSIYGKKLDLRVSFFPLKDNNKYMGFIIIVNDITEKNLYITRLIQKQKMETIGLLSAGISHEYNNILSIIQGYIDLIYNSSSKEEINEYLDAINKAIDRGKSITNRLLGYSKENSIKNIEEFTVKELIDELIHIIKPEFKLIDIKFFLKDENNKIYGNKNILLQAMLNICLNAKEAMNGKGELAIQTKKVKIDRQFILLHPEGIEGDFIQISFTDSGKGIPKKELNKIFDPFYSKSGLAKSSGLGLYIVYNIIKDHNGFISVYSEEGKGSTFKIYLPVLEKEENNSNSYFEFENNNENDFDGSNKKILVVDDEDDLRNIFVKILKNKNFTVYEASNEKECLKIVKNYKEELELVILDYTLKDTTGKELFYKIKKISPEIKVILMSGYGLNGIINKMLYDGLDSFIQKPFKIGKLIKVIQKVLKA